MSLGGAPDCPKCGDRVYFGDEKAYAGKKWHKKCFACTSCQKQLESGNANMSPEDQIVCGSCLRKTANNNKQGGGGYVNKDDPECCPRCGKRVYFAEQKIALGRKWHNITCFTCASCAKKVDSTTVVDHDGEVYCKACHGRLFGPKGYGYAGGAGTMLSMDTGSSNQVTTQNVPHTAEAYVAPMADQSNGSSEGRPALKFAGRTGSVGGGSDVCGRCGKTVYLAERKLGAGNVFHTTCFNCAICNKKLDSSILTEKEGDIFCKSCYGKNFGPKGYGYGTGAGTLQMN